MTDLAPLTNATKAIEAIQEAQATTFEFAVPAGWKTGMLLAATVARSLESFGSEGITESEFLLAFATPREMPKRIFQALQEFEESLEAAVAQGKDCLNASMGLHGEVGRLLDVAPWTLHAVHGCVLIEEVNELDRRALVQARRASGKSGDDPATRTSSCSGRTSIPRLRASRPSSRNPAMRAGQHGS